MALRTLLLFVYVLITLVLFATFDATPSVWVSFFTSALILFFITIHHLFKEREFSPFISCFIVFSFLFFIVAPIVQINSFKGIGPAFMQNFPYRSELAVQANSYIILFNSTFFLAYIGLKKSSYFKYTPQVSKSILKLRPFTLIVVGLITVVILFVSIPFLLDELRRPSWQVSDYSVATLLIWKKVLFLIPFAGLILCIKYLRFPSMNITNFSSVIFMALFFFIALIWFKNPFTEKRNALGPIYICMLFLFLPKLLNSNVKILSFMFFSMVILFPISAIITHSDASFNEIMSDPGILLEQMKGGGISNAFNTLNYDAFANFMVNIEMVEKQGISWGHQLLSALFFFVPRGLWEGKPWSSGQVTGDYLIDTYDFNFNNLSNPLVSEGFINFGIIGVILFAIGLAIVIRIFSRWLKGSDILKKIMAFYFAIHLIFLLRGDFTNGYSYYMGTLVGVLIIPKMVELVLNNFFKKKRLWNTSRIT